ncbi:MAG: TM1266 family iron-only hydrogenase system putative regulator [Candidatus Caldatribacteriota bacterium]|nr:TM1266 family iron-only hydrogenase system putative regulator [Candidatus Caldatribacteriota bacterium]
MFKRTGTVTIIISDRANQSSEVNKILSKHAEIIIGRMGLPYSLKKISIICLIVNGSTDQLGSLTGQLGSIEGIQVKSVMAKE